MLKLETRILKIVCLVFGILLFIQFSRFAMQPDALDNVTMPKPPSAPASASSGTNSAPGAKPETAVGPGPGVRPPGMPMMPGMPGMPPGMPGGAPAMNLPPAVQSQVDRITQSEILAPVQRPMPMALLGIAGHDAMIRAPNGQTGLVREGEQIGGIKLVRIGTNRVVVEENGQTKELTIFSGFGSPTLLSK